MKLKAMALLLTMTFAGISFAGELEDILAKHYEALGGKKVLDGTTSMKSEGKVVFKSAQGEMEIPFKQALKDGTKMRIDATMQGMTMTQVVTKDGGWQVNPMMGSMEPQAMSEDEAKPLREQADFRGDLYNYEEKGNKVELLGKEDVEGTETYKLKVTTKDGDVRHYFLDSEYYLIIKSTGKSKQMGMEFEYTMFPSDYKTVDGMMIAHSYNQKSDMGEMTIQVNSIERNVEVDDKLFEKPAAPAAEENK